MNTIRVINGNIACRPFKRSGVETKSSGVATTADSTGPKKNGLQLVGQKMSLTALEVLWGNGDIRKGETVYVRGTSVAAAWARDIQTIPGLTDQADTSKILEFIFVPTTEVMMVEQLPAEVPQRPSPTSLPRDY